jgi:hypothetical protein
MKIIVLKTATIILLILAGSLVSCRKEKEDGAVPYVACDSEEQNYITTANVEGDAYLFNDSIPETMKIELQQKRDITGFVEWIIYVQNDNSAVLNILSKKEESTNYICNYPEFAKQWKIPQTGLMVYYKGVTYELGRYLSVPSLVSNDMILINLKNKKL